MALLQAKVDGGILEGLPAANQMFSVFRGVPFAAPPVGELRWKDPQPVEPWPGVRDATRYAPKAAALWPPSFTWAIIKEARTAFT